MYEVELPDFEVDDVDPAPPSPTVQSYAHDESASSDVTSGSARPSTLHPTSNPRAGAPRVMSRAAVRRWICAVPLLLVARVAVGEEDASRRSEARAAYDRGTQLLAAGDDDGALEAFVAADTSVPSEQALEAAALASEHAKGAPALETLCRRIEERTLEPRALGLARAACDRRGLAFGALRLTCSAECAPRLDGEPITVGTTSLREGSHTLSVGGKDARIEVRRHERLERAWSPEPPTRALPTSDAPSTGIHPAWFFAGLGLTAVAGATTIGSGVDAATKHGRFVDDRCALSVGQRKASDASCTLLAREGSSAQLRTNVLAGITGGLGLATALVGAFGVRWSTPVRAAHVELSPTAVSLDVVF